MMWGQVGGGGIGYVVGEESKSLDMLPVLCAIVLCLSLMNDLVGRLSLPCRLRLLLSAVLPANCCAPLNLAVIWAPVLLPRQFLKVLVRRCNRTF